MLSVLYMLKLLPFELGGFLLSLQTYCTWLRAPVHMQVKVHWNLMHDPHNFASYSATPFTPLPLLQAPQLARLAGRAMFFQHQAPQLTMLPPLWAFSAVGLAVGDAPPMAGSTWVHEAPSHRGALVHLFNDWLD